METVAPLAQSISTYGLYAIIAVLCVVVVYLFRRLNALEREMRDTIRSHADDGKAYAAEVARLLSQTTDALKDNTKAFNDFQNAVADMRTALQLAMERMK
ncbi:MAG: hypothetical protein IJ165_10000 [Proteobacteria bacterium]|nr:hypothetical protein [Pseudomonadota bacterium]MBR2308199.1 hypothetical protein [Fibrobacter sp.]